MEFSEWLTDIMARNGWTQDEFADRAEIAHSTFNAYITRKTQPMPDKLRGFSKATGTSMRRLLIICGFATEQDFRTRSLSQKEEALLHWFRQVPHGQKDLVVAMLRSAIRSQEDQAPEVGGGGDTN